MKRITKYIFEEQDKREFLDKLNHKNLSLREFAKLNNIHVSKLSKYINGKLLINEKILEVLINE